MTTRIPLDAMTSDQLDALYERLHRTERAVGLLAEAHRCADRAEVDALNKRLADAHRRADQAEDEHRQAHETKTENTAREMARADQAEAAIARVRQLHAWNAHTACCEHCSERDYPDYAVPWPCPTIAALDA